MSCWEVTAPTLAVSSLDGLVANLVSLPDSRFALRIANLLLAECTLQWFADRIPVVTLPGAAKAHPPRCTGLGWTCWFGAICILSGVQSVIFLMPAVASAQHSAAVAAQMHEQIT